MLQRYLLHLCYINNISRLKFILKHFKFLLPRSTYYNILISAVKLDCTDIVELIVKYHNFNDSSNPLYWAIIRGNIKTVKILLEHSVPKRAGLDLVERATQLELDNIVSLEYLGNGNPTVYNEISKELLNNKIIFTDVVNRYYVTSRKLKVQLVKKLELENIDELENFMKIF